MIYNRFFPYKILKYSNKLEAIANNQIPYPVVLHIYLTNTCNNDCDFCIMQNEKKKVGTLGKDILIKVLQDAHKIGVKLVHFSGGGEPTLNKNLLNSVMMANKLNMETALSTNGSKYIPTLMKYLNYLRISVNAGTNKKYSEIMKPKDKHTFTDIKNISKQYLNDRKKFKTPKLCDIGWAFVLTDKNYKDIYKFCKEANDVGVDFVHIRPAFLKDDTILKTLIIPTFKRIEKAKKEFKKLKIYNISNKFNGYWTSRTYDKCRSTPLIAVLSATGEFIVCQDVFIRFGNIYKQTFKDIWGSKEHKKAMKKICLKQCPRCVENNINEIIQHCFINNDVRMNLI